MRLRFQPQMRPALLEMALRSLELAPEPSRTTKWFRGTMR
jgi:hypothetical protein